jgi:hypothetical protein
MAGYKAVLDLGERFLMIQAGEALEAAIMGAAEQAFPQPTTNLIFTSHYDGASQHKDRSLANRTLGVDKASWSKCATGYKGKNGTIL